MHTGRGQRGDATLFSILTVIKIHKQQVTSVKAEEVKQQQFNFFTAPIYRGEIN